MSNWNLPACRAVSFVDAERLFGSLARTPPTSTSPIVKGLMCFLLSGSGSCCLRACICSGSVLGFFVRSEPPAQRRWFLSVHVLSC